MYPTRMHQIGEARAIAPTIPGQKIGDSMDIQCSGEWEANSRKAVHCGPAFERHRELPRAVLPA